MLSELKFHSCPGHSISAAICETWGRVLSWKRIGSCLLIIVRHKCCSFSCTLSISSQFFCYDAFTRIQQVLMNGSTCQPPVIGSFICHFCSYFSAEPKSIYYGKYSLHLESISYHVSQCNQEMNHFCCINKHKADNVMVDFMIFTSAQSAPICWVVFFYLVQMLNNCWIINA